ncbi:glycosyltransferase [Haliangium sp.]|uniref:glycosyltransferase n=1 Tax=Haliangium sp. TaxID=2663208 RepID=UPI003D0C3818
MGPETSHIPKLAHFIWLGSSFPWIYGMALRSAAVRGGFDQVYLHHRDDISTTPGWAAAMDHPRVQARRLEPERVLAGAGPRGDALVALYGRLSKPAAQTNMVRAALLATEGGVYLDTDTVTVRSFEPLLATGVFCGRERIALTGEVRRARRPGPLLGAGARLALRELFRLLPGGWRGFRRVEPWFHLAVNNAVLGAQPGHPFILGMLDRMLALPPARQLVRYALGTVLLQGAVADWEGDDLVVHPPERFYPLGPEISEHWFRPTQAPALDQVMGPDTTLVHWYASVRTKRYVPQFDPAYVRAHRDRQLLSALLAEFL